MPGAANTDERDYIREALSFSLDLPWEVLGRLEIKRKVETQFHPGQTIVMYPPFEALAPDYDEKALFERVSGIGVGSLSMYLHVPFCTGICTYCSYARSARRQSDVMTAYVKALMRQRDEWISRLDVKPGAVDTIFIGGGTPTTLDEHTLLRLVDTTPRSRDCEFSVETDPDMATRSDGPGKLAALRRGGVNRISMGVETFDDKLAKSIGRRGHDRVPAALEAIRQAGFNDINIDLMYGLPNQSLQSWLETLQEAVDTDVPSVTLYCYKLKPGSVDWRRSKSTSIELEYGRRVVVMQKMGEMYLCDKGYSVVNGKWFVKTKKTFRQQTRKYQNSILLGFGPSTYSFFGNCQLVSRSNTNGYIAAVTNDMPVVERGRMLCDDELAYRRFVFGLKSGVNSVDALAKASPSAKMRINAKMEELVAAGLLTTEGDRIILSDIGRLFADEVCRLMYSPAVEGQLEPAERAAAFPMAGDLALSR
jgi:oxygen-independent coproporphyrinogen III oxidase